MRFILSFLLLISNMGTLCAQDFLAKYNDVVYESFEFNSLNNILEVSKRGNSLDFILLGLNVNNRNELYSKTKDSIYLEENRRIIMNVMNASIEKDDEYLWRAKTNLKETDNKEVQLYEGYFFRYVGEFCYNGYINGYEYEVELQLLKNVFFKWLNRSVANYGNYEGLFSSRIHMGSHWGIISQYLNVLDNESTDKRIYENVIENYNYLLKYNLINAKSNNDIWHSTYDLTTKSSKAIVQDVAHANHVLLYVIVSYEVGDSNWSKEDLLFFSKLLREKLYSKSRGNFYDLVNMEYSKNNSLKNSGRRQSDGWMKLIKYNSELCNLYKDFYSINKRVVDLSIYNTQFYVQMTNCK